MRKIVALNVLDNFQLELKFSDGNEKRFDFKPYLQFPVFSILKNREIFQKVKNCGYFIEWKEYEIDLSADTLWHEGI